jgi:hypothetical protein
MEYLSLVAGVTPIKGHGIEARANQEFLLPAVGFLADVMDFGCDDVSRVRCAPLQGFAVQELAFLSVGVVSESVGIRL